MSVRKNFNLSVKFVSGDLHPIINFLSCKEVLQSIGSQKVQIATAAQGLGVISTVVTERGKLFMIIFVYGNE